MPGRKITIFGHEFELPENTSFSSSSTSRNTLLVESGTEITINLAEDYLGVLKLAQGLTSLYAMCCNSTHIYEKLAHFLLSATAFAHFGIFTAIFFQHIDCEVDEDSLCDGQFYLHLLYAGFLLLIQGVSQYAQDPSVPVGSTRVNHEQDLEAGIDTDSSHSSDDESRVEDGIQAEL